MRSACLALLLFLFVLLPARAAAPAGAALVIGNSTYPALPPLPACADSAQVVAAALQRDGFVVTQLADASNGEMGAAIADFATRLASPPARAAVLYVCGYAAGYAGRTFLLPASADIQRETDLLTQGLVAKSLMNMVMRSAAPAGLILFDAVATPSAVAAPLGLDRLAAEPAQGGIGLAAAALAAPLPQGATRLAARFAQELGAPRIETAAMLASLAATIGETLAVRPPATQSWLLGAPPVEPAPATAPAPAPEPVPARPPEAAQTATLSPNPPRAGEAIAMPDEAHMTEADRRHVQAALAKLGYYDGAVDGVFGPDTRAAIRRFQHEIGAAMDGRVKPDQAARLRAAGP